MLLVVGAMVWFALLVTAPVLPAAAAAPLYAVGALICHQLPARSFHWGAAQLPVCARCIGIYGGCAVGALLIAVTRDRVALRTRRAARLVLTAAMLPTIVTVVLEWTGAWHPSNGVRAAAGLVLGSGAGALLTAAVATLHYGRCPQTPSDAYSPPPPLT